MFEQIEIYLENNVLVADILAVLLDLITIVVIAAIAKKVITKIVVSYLEKKGTKQSITLKGVAESTIKYLILFFVVTAVLDVFGVPFTSIVAVAGIGSVAVGFGAQSLVKDVITGAFILFEDQFGVGDFVELENKSGRVENVGLRTTLVRNPLNNEVYIIPNSEIKIVTNQTRDFQKALVHFELPYDTDLKSTMILVEKAIRDNLPNQDRLLSEPTVVGAISFNESGISIRVNCDTISGEVWAVERDIRVVIKECLDENNISMPYPTQDVNIISSTSK